MKILRKQISKDGEGVIKLRVDEPEDFYHLFHLICKGDFVRASTVRKVVTESSTGSVSSQRQRMNLTLEVDRVEYEPGAEEMRVMGRNREENPFVKLGANHTLDLSLHQEFTLRKPCWDAMYLERLQNATDLRKRAEVLAVVMDMGYALVCLVTSFMTVVQAKITVPIAKKRGDDSHAKSVDRFFAQVYEAVLKSCDLEVVKCILVASPGFVKDDFVRYLDTKLAPSAQLTVVRKKMLLVHSTSGHKHALMEVMNKPEVQIMMKDTKAAEEVKALDRFFEMLNVDEYRAVYGVKHVSRALQAGAVEVLLVCDDLFRTADTRKQRNQYVQMVEDAKALAAQVFVFSKMHVSGEQLSGLTGVAAILRYAMPTLDDDVEREEQEEIQEEEEEQEGVHGASEAVLAMMADFE